MYLHHKRYTHYYVLLLLLYVWARASQVVVCFGDLAYVRHSILCSILKNLCRIYS